MFCNSIVLMDRHFDITNQDELSTGATLKMAEADDGTCIATTVIVFLCKYYSKV